MHEPFHMADDPHGSPMTPVLYSFRRCPYAMRARLAIAVASTGCVLREVKLSAKPEAMLAASPKGTVPVLVLPDGQVIDESLDIMRWALATQDPEHWLEGDDPELIDRNDGPFKHDLDRYKYPERYGVEPLKHRALGSGVLAGTGLPPWPHTSALRTCPLDGRRCDHAIRATVRCHRPNLVQCSTVAASQELAG
jgi:glutaredoxin